MASELYSLVFTKNKDALLKYDSANHDIFVLDSMPLKSYEAKNAFEQDWNDEHGLDVYDSQNVYLKAYELTIPIIVRDTINAETLKVDSTWANNIIGFVNYLTKDGSLHTMTNGWTGEEHKDVRFVKLTPKNHIKNKGGRIHVIYDLVVKVTNPKQED